MICRLCIPEYRQTWGTNPTFEVSYVLRLPYALVLLLITTSARTLFGLSRIIGEGSKREDIRCYWLCPVDQTSNEEGRPGV